MVKMYPGAQEETLSKVPASGHGSGSRVPVVRHLRAR